MIDLKEMVDSINMPCAVMSVERVAADETGDRDSASAGRSKGVIRIEKANRRFLEFSGDDGRYYDGIVYSEYVPHEDIFEDYCRRAALQGKRVHTYMRPVDGVTWADLMVIPMTSEDESKGFCQVMFEPEPDLNAGYETVPVSIDTATAVIRNLMTLMGTADFGMRVRKVLADILRIAEARNGRIVLLDDEKHEAPVLCEMLAEGLDSSMMPGDGVIPYPVVKGWEMMMGSRDSTILNNEQDIEMLGSRNPRLAEMMKRNQVYSILMLPLRRERKTIGFMYVVNFNVDKTVEIKELVELLAFFLGSEIFNHQLMDKLHTMGTTDELTGLNNRHALRERMDRVRDIRDILPLGIVNLDLNGLKEINDSEGHDAGDAMLRHAADVLRGIFAGHNVYRVGGDEFAVIVRDVTRMEFDELIAQVADASENDPGFSTAIGSFWADKASGEAIGLENAYAIADSKMYEDKRQFYIKHPEKNRRRA